MIHLLFGLIDEAKTQAFVDDFNSLDDEEPLDLFIETDGGINSGAMTILTALNSIRERASVNLMGNVSSAGFAIFFDFKGHRTVDNYAFSFIHHSNYEISSRSLLSLNGSKVNAEMQITDAIKEADKIFIETLKPYLTEGEIESLNLGEDVFLNADRLRRIISEQEQKEYIFNVTTTEL